VVNPWLRVKKKKEKTAPKKWSVAAAGFSFMSLKPKNIEGPFLKKFNFLFISLVLLAVLAAFFLWWRWALSPFNSQSTEKNQTFIIKKGESLSSVAFRLQQEKLIHSAAALKFLIMKDDLEGKIQAGSFQLKPSLNLLEVADLLVRGTQDIWLTFPEGWRQEEYARRLASNLENFDQEEFLNLAVDYEGELFPDTYLLPREASAAGVFQLLHKNFQKKFSADLFGAADKAGLSQKEVLIIASLVEREARHDQDRPIVAGILIKRWKADWPLQIDATLQYALANLRCQSLKIDCDWWVTPTVADKKIVSPYNTYLNRGLPPAPICNPGLSSIKAVVYPQDSDYWFYLSDSKGQMHYSRTIEEHNDNIQNYL
jgi:UPF0755 protein